MRHFAVLAFCSFFAVSALGQSAPAAAPAQSPQGVVEQSVAPVNDAEYTTAVARLIQSAQHNLRLMLYQTRYYGEYPDTATNAWVDDLIAARARGVDVQVIVDTGNWNPSMKNDYNLDYVDRLTTAGIRIWEDSESVVSHQKVILVDDAITLVASNNWSYYSLAKNYEVAVVVQSRPLNAWFVRYFEERKAEGRPRANVSATVKPAGRPGVTKGELVGFNWMPFDRVDPIPNRLFYPAVHEAIINARQSVTVLQRSLTMYNAAPRGDVRARLPLGPASETNALVDDLVAAQKRGVKVNVILDNNEGMDDPDNDVTAGYLMARGVSVFRDSLSTQTHAKLVVVDDNIAVVGSTNWTRPALEDGNEASVMLHGRAINKVYRDYVTSILRSSAPYQVISQSIWDTTPTTSRKKTPKAED